jgi:lipopolysaccharide transport system permease protein
MSAPVIVYTPESELRKPVALLRAMVGDLANARNLAWRLALRDIRAEYRQSYFGYLWAFISPLATTVVWVFLNASGVVTVADTDIPYPAYVFSGTMLWQIFMQALQSPVLEIGAARSMLTKLNFPREAILMAGLLKQGLNTLIKIAILVPAVLLFGVVPDWHLLLFPLALAVLIITGFGLGLLLAPVGMLYTDIGRAIPLVGQFAMYITPVVFAMPKEGALAKVFEYNFVSPLILTARAWLTGLESPMLPYFLVVASVAAMVLVVGWVIFRITMPVLIERMSS